MGVLQQADDETHGACEIGTGTETSAMTSLSTCIIPCSSSTRELDDFREFPLQLKERIAGMEAAIEATK